MTPQQLRNSILQMAIEGKLTRQLPEDGNAADLLKKIKAEKAKLIKEKKIKKEKPLPPITEDEIPFEVPENWCWVRLRDVVYNRGQKKPDNRFCYIDIGSINNKNQTVKVANNVVEAKDAPSRARKIVGLGDILYATVRPYLHNMCIMDNNFEYETIASTGFAVMTCVNSCFNRYLFLYLLSPTFDNYANANENSKGVAYPAISDERLYKAVVPLPPLAVQKRIVARLEEILPLVDAYEKAYNELQELNKKFPVKLKNSLLQMAIEGKLVEQRLEDGNAADLLKKIKAEKAKLIKEKKIKKEKPLPEIRDDEIPFEVPENWVWCKAGSLLEVISGTSYKKHDVKKIGLRIIRGGNLIGHDVKLLDDDVYLSEEFFDENKCVQSYDIVVVASTGSITGIGRTAFVNDSYSEKFQIGAFLRILRIFAKEIYEYVRFVYESEYYREHIRKSVVGIGIKNLKEEYIREMLVPLPPLGEQKRIVAKLEQLLPLCDELMKHG